MRERTDFRQRLIQARRTRGWTAERLAGETNAAAGVEVTSRDIVTRMENGQRRTLPIGEAASYAKALGVKPERLLFEGDDPAALSVFSEYHGLTNGEAKGKWSSNGKRAGVRVRPKRRALPPNRDVVCRDRGTGGVVAVHHTIGQAVRWLRANGHPLADSGNISEACTGKRRSAYSYLWEYKQATGNR